MNRTATTSSPARNVRHDDFVAQMERSERLAVVEAISRVEMAELERKDIAKRIKQARKEAGLTQPEMAEALGIIQRTYQNYESTKEPRTPWGLMNDIAKISGKTTEWLIHGDRATPDLMGSLNGSASGDTDLREQLDRIERMLNALLTVHKIRQAYEQAELARTATPESAPGPGRRRRAA